MKSSLSNSSQQIKEELTWQSPLSHLYPKKKATKTAIGLMDAGIHSLWDLLWLFPLRVQRMPTVQNFDKAISDQLFKGRGKVLSVQSRPNFKGKGKKGARLMNVTAHIQDSGSADILLLRWFNAYPSMAKKVEMAEQVQFLGMVQSYQGQKQVVNPEIHTTWEDDTCEIPSLKVQYPTINTVGTSFIKKIVDKIPVSLWDDIPESLPERLLISRDFPPLQECFRTLHGRGAWSPDLEELAKNRIIYEEFYREQLKIYLRRQKYRAPKGIELSVKDKVFNEFLELFPYQLTDDQVLVSQQIRDNLSAGTPMMRLVQGDVGCGKTSVALIAALITIASGAQVALMCPTESLALQHYMTIKELLEPMKITVNLLIGSTNSSGKKIIYKELESGEIRFIIGTHALFQDSVSFEKLGLAIIDEQHKFGVNQRLKLLGKGEGTHCLIMTATPIPRSLSLTQYGDLDISTIRTMPSGRKGQQTRIIGGETFQKFLNFFNTRLSMGEQAYVVVPAINESETQDMMHLTQVLERFRQLFPDYRIEGLHGQLKSEEKVDMFKKFTAHEVDVLISTSVVEVGINVLNATIMAVMNPERFGLSSLHQLRGRVGRGTKPGFCFLVSDKPLSSEARDRLKVIEGSTDGFKIAEEDLKIRGEGDLFGTSQSGEANSRKFANILLHHNVLLKAQEDTQTLISEREPETMAMLEHFSQDERIFSTI